MNAIVSYLKIACAVLLLSAAAGPAGAAELRAGAATVKITPPMGTPMAGYYSARGAEGVMDDLYAKALVLDDGRTSVALVVCDLIGIPRETILEARRLIQEQTGIPTANVMISATHTHTGPVLARKSPRDDLDGGNSPLSVTYTAGLPRLIAQAVADAGQHREKALVFNAREAETKAAFCRRYWMKDGTVGWNPGKLNPKVIRPVSGVDPEVGVVYFTSPARKALATYVNYAIHTDMTGGKLISADMPGALSRILAGYKGPEMVTLFANGACGNNNHFNTASGEPQRPLEAYRLGAILGADVFKAYMDLKPVTDTTLRVRQAIVPLTPAPVTDADVKQAREIVKMGPKAKFLDQVQAYKALDVAAWAGKPLETEVQVITMGNTLAWVALPGEIFMELGTSIKAASPYPQTHIVELANASIGYVPNRSAYAEGNYEVVSTRVAAGSGEKMVEAALGMMADIQANPAK